MTDPNTDGRMLSQVSEGELHEHQREYIGELHSQIVAMIEVVQGVVRPLMSENKEMMRIVSDSQRRLAEVEHMRLEHDFRVRMHEEEKEERVAEREASMQKWVETMALIKDTDAFDALLTAILNKVSPENAREPRATRGDKGKPPATPESGGAPLPPAKIPQKGEPEAEPEAKPDDETDGSTEEEIDPKKAEVIAEMAKNPLASAAEALKMSIDEKRQWKVIYQALNKQQAQLFDDLLAAGSDDEVRTHLKEILRAKNALSFKKLESNLDEHQRSLIGFIIKHGR